MPAIARCRPVLGELASWRAAELSPSRADGFTAPADSLSGTRLLMGVTAVPGWTTAVMYDDASGKTTHCPLVTEVSARVVLLGLNLNSHGLQIGKSVRQIDCRAGVLLDRVEPPGGPA